MFKKKGYIFTNKEHSEKGIMSTVLGILSIITLTTAVYISYLQKGEISARCGAAAFLATLFMAAGLLLGIWSAAEKEKFRLFSVVGIILNILAVGMLSLILFAGAYVD